MKRLILGFLIIVLVLGVFAFFYYPKYKEKKIQADFKVIARQRLEDLKSDAAQIWLKTKKCERKESSFFGQPETYYGSRTDHIDEYSDNYFIEVRKTDSLTSPYIAIARYPYAAKFYYSGHKSTGIGGSEKECLESPAWIKNEENILTFAYQNGKWVEATR